MANNSTDKIDYEKASHPPRLLAVAFRIGSRGYVRSFSGGQVRDESGNPLLVRVHRLYSALR